MSLEEGRILNSHRTLLQCCGVTLVMTVLKKLAKLLGLLLIIGAVVVVVILVHSTMAGTTQWFFRVNGHVTINGRETSGYMHANTLRTFLFVTTTDGRKPETYVVPLIRIKMWDCGNWHPIRFLPTPTGAWHPCNLPADPAEVVDPPLPKTLVCRQRSVEFTTSSGRKVRAEW
jgi:hypothetical protein